jgi:hypothetical protein
VESIKRLNDYRIKSEPATRKLAAMSKAQSYRSSHTRDISDGRVSSLAVTTMASLQSRECNTAAQDGLEDKVTYDGDSVLHRDVTATGGNSDELWKGHYVSKSPLQVVSTKAKIEMGT